MLPRNNDGNRFWGMARFPNVTSVELAVEELLDVIFAEFCIGK